MSSVAHLYRIENLKTGEYYIGKHKGESQNGYWGSGDRIKRQLKKYGKKNFSYKILCISTTDYIFDLESKIVTIQLIESDEKCLNLVGGGNGPSALTNQTIEKIRIKAISERKNNPEKWNQIAKKIGLNKRGIIFSEKHKQNLSDANKGLQPWNKGKTNTVSPEGLESLRNKCKIITSNSKWINDGFKNKRVQKEQLHNFLEIGWSEGRINKRLN